MTLTEQFGLLRGDCVAVIGAGGKTTLIERLADEWVDSGALIAPTTRIAIAQQRERRGVHYLGIPEAGKLTAAPLPEIHLAATAAALTLMEADGSRQLLIKGWAAHEPVVPTFATLTIGVINERAVGLAATAEHVHRLPLFLQQAGLAEGDIVTQDCLINLLRRRLDLCAVGRTLIAVYKEDGKWTSI